MNFLNSEDKAFGPEFRPFLPFFDPKNAGPSTGLFVYLNPHHKSNSDSKEMIKAATKEKPTSSENLKKLNEQLKQKKR